MTSAASASVAQNTEEHRYLSEMIDEAVKNHAVDSAALIGRRVRINGYNYLLETKITGVQFAVWMRPENLMENKEWRPVVDNIRLTIEDTGVFVDKKRWKLVRTIKHLSWAPGVVRGHLIVVFNEDGYQNLKEAEITLID